MQASDPLWEKVQRRMAAVGVREEELRESFVLGGGSGGQKVNKTAHAVQLTWLREGRVVKCADARSQHLNRIKAREKLCELLETERAQTRQEKAAKRAKIRYQRRTPGPAEQAKRLDSKRRTAQNKQQRRRPASDG